MQPKKLEHYKFFQPFAWIICVLFAVFVGMLAMELNTSINNLESSSAQAEQRLENLEKAIGTNNYQNSI
ncbi:MAG: hypothetical protein KBC78_03995 [Candidatus Pacebacteria bacterium]|nr:hypothetical protein [Candidatus Paceibacterota bacterium]